MDEQLMREYISTVKSEKRKKAAANMGKLLGVFGKTVPKGIRHPDSLVHNVHLYKPGVRGKTKLM